MKIHLTVESIQETFKLTGKGKNVIPAKSKLRSINNEIHIATDPDILKFLMSLQGIECVIRYGGAEVFWDENKMCFGVFYADGNTDNVYHCKEVRRIIDEWEHDQMYGTRGHDSESPFGEGRDDFDERDNDKALMSKGTR